MGIYFNNDIYNYFCKEKIYNYYIKGKRGFIEFDLETPYFKKMNLFSSLTYSFDVITAYEFKYLEKLNPQLVEEEEFLVEYELGKPQKILIEKIIIEYFLRKKAEGKEIIDLYLDLKFYKHDCSINTSILDESEDISVLDELGYNSKMPPYSEIEKEFDRINDKGIYNITLPLSNLDNVDIPTIISPFNFFTGIKTLLEANAKEFLFLQPDYFNILKSIGTQGQKYNNDRSFSIDRLNTIREKINAFKSNPLVNMVQDLFYSLVKTIETSQKISVCNHCGTIIRYVKGKKYCSYKSEGRDCGKSARNRRTYLRKKNNFNKAPTEYNQKSLF